MLHYIKGHVAETLPGMVVIDHDGIGYEVNVADGSPVFLADPSEEITLYVALQVREDDMSLYGFMDKESLSLFRLLQTVSGVGAKAALSMLGAFTCAQELKRAIFFEDVASITRANGIGKKTAQRVVLELKDKVGEPAPVAGEPAKTGVRAPGRGSHKDEALQALVSLGFARAEAMSLLNTIVEDDLSTEEYIKLALRARR